MTPESGVHRHRCASGVRLPGCRRPPCPRSPCPRRPRRPARQPAVCSRRPAVRAQPTSSPCEPRSTHSASRQIENGDREPSIKALAALAAALGVELGELTAGSDPGASAPLLAAVAAPEPRGFANPDYRGTDKPRRRPTRPTDVETAVEQAHRALSLLTPGERLEAVSRLLRRVVPEVVDEQVRERRR